MENETTQNETQETQETQNEETKVVVAETTTTKKTKATSLSDAEFIREWESADNIGAFCESTGYEKTSAQARASGFRSNGVPLKAMSRAKASKDDLLALLAEIRSNDESEVTVADLQAQAAKDKERRDEINAKRTATQEANASKEQG